MAKEHREQGIPFFNTYNFPGSAEKFILSCEESCKKVLTDGYSKWTTCNKIEENLKKHWDDIEIRKYWAMALIREYAFTIWNSLFKCVRKEKGEHAAHKVSDDAFENYLKKFR